MKVLLNLLPEQHRESVRRKYYDRFFFRQAVIAFGIEFFCLILLGGVFLLVRENRVSMERFEAEQSRSETGMEELSRYEARFADTNAVVDDSAKFYREHVSWSDFLVAFESTVPENVTLSRLSTKDYQVMLAGTADTRDDFLELERRLKEEPCFSDVSAPVSNLFSKEHVGFQVDFSVKDECLKPGQE